MSDETILHDIREKFDDSCTVEVDPSAHDKLDEAVRESIVPELGRGVSWEDEEYRNFTLRCVQELAEEASRLVGAGGTPDGRITGETITSAVAVRLNGWMAACPWQAPEAVAPGGTESPEGSPARRPSLKISRLGPPCLRLMAMLVKQP